MIYSRSIIEKFEQKVRPIYFWLTASFLMLVIGLNAWVSDDAYITFRTVANLVNGYGPVYNVGERVQTFTNPLWMLVMTPLYALTGEAYFTSIFLSWAFSFASIWMLFKRIFVGKMSGIVVLVEASFAKLHAVELIS